MGDAPLLTCRVQTKHFAREMLNKSEIYVQQINDRGLFQDVVLGVEICASVGVCLSTQHHLRLFSHASFLEILPLLSAAIILPALCCRLDTLLG